MSDAIRVRSCVHDLINSHRVPSPKFDVLHDIYIVLSLVQTNFEAILSNCIYRFIPEVRHYICVCLCLQLLSGTLDLARSRAAEPWPRPHGLDWKGPVCGRGSTIIDLSFLTCEVLGIVL